MADRIVDPGHAFVTIRERLYRQLAATRDDDLAALVEELSAHPIFGLDDEPPSEPGAGEVLGPVTFRVAGGGELSFFGMFATFDTPFEVTTSELAMELLFPADRATAQALEARAA
jgi:hypothetical protein